VTFDVFGAQGNDIFQRRQGLGGEARASFHVTAGQIFEIVVGGSPPRDREEKGGFNGGGSGFGTGFGGGGGASDVRVGACASSNACGLEDRIVVGGGGGGGVGGGAPGDGGGRTGANGAREGGHGGSQISGGAGDGHGSFGHGGDAPIHYCSQSPGGGGGWFGGGSSGGRCDALSGGGGGGSGFISPLAVSGSFPGGKESGDGKVIVTFS
jgi:hypothetical protein